MTPARQLCAAFLWLLAGLVVVGALAVANDETAAALIEGWEAP